MSDAPRLLPAGPRVMTERMGRTFDVTTSILSSLARAGAGRTVGRLGPRPEQRIDIYEFESCPFCRKVREALTHLDLTVRILPCPPGGQRFRPEVERLGGKQQFPFLIDPNTGAQMYESDNIITHLYDRYGAEDVPRSLRLGALTTATSALASLPRLTGRGVRPSRQPDLPIEMWGYEGSPYCRLVREALCMLELPYVYHNVGVGSPSRTAFVEKSGRMQVPYVVDPNADVALFESADIIMHLEKTYAL